MLDRVGEAVVPESVEKGRGWKWASGRLAILVAGVLVGTLASAWVQFAFDTHSAVHKAKSDDEAQEVLEGGKPPFRWKVSPALGRNESGTAWVLDRELTFVERANLLSLDGTRTDDLWQFVERLGGRRLDETEFYELQLTSEREKPVLITKVTATPTRCWRSKVETAIFFGSTGESQPWDEILFKLRQVGSPAPWLKYNTEEPGRETEKALPFKKAILLGSAESPGLLKLHLDSPKTCEWQLNVTYNINSGDTRYQTITRDENGKKLLHEAPFAEGSLATFEWDGFRWIE